MDWKVLGAVLLFLLFAGNLYLFFWALNRNGPPTHHKRLKRGPPPDFTP